MLFGPTFRIAIRSLKANKLRSALTMLGIVIGVAAVITMLAVGEGAQASLAKTISSLGSNLVIISPGTTTSGGARSGSGNITTLVLEDTEAIERECSAVYAAAPSVRGAAQVIYRERNWSTEIQGTTESYMYAREWEVEEGRFINRQDVDGRTKNCVLGKTVVDELFGSEDPIGRVVRINRVPFTVVGTLREKGETPMGSNQDDAAIIPVTTAQSRIFGINYLNRIYAKGVSKDSMEKAVQQITELLRQRHRIPKGQDDDFSVRNLTEILDMAETQTKIMKLLLGSVASISLLVGGIGIMNIMLVSVTERTREIGIRMALGAKTRDIMTQFLVESVVLSVIGGLTGILLGVGLSMAVGKISGGQVEAVVSSLSVVLSFGFSAGIGIFFGYYPARKAANLDPITALRYE
jgi:putative ABC transport system permease protein